MFSEGRRYKIQDVKGGYRAKQLPGGLLSASALKGVCVFRHVFSGGRVPLLTQRHHSPYLVRGRYTPPRRSGLSTPPIAFCQNPQLSLVHGEPLIHRVPKVHVRHTMFVSDTYSNFGAVCERPSRDVQNERRLKNLGPSSANALQHWQFNFSVIPGPPSGKDGPGHRGSSPSRLHSRVHTL